MGATGDSGNSGTSPEDCPVGAASQRAPLSATETRLGCPGWWGIGGQGGLPVQVNSLRARFGSSWIWSSQFNIAIIETPCTLHTIPPGVPIGLATL